MMLESDVTARGGPEGIVEEGNAQRPTGEMTEQLFTRVERAKQQWEAAVDALPELICVVDQEARVVRANRTVERWHMASVKAVAGRELHELLHPECKHACSLHALLMAGTQQATAGAPEDREFYDPWLGRHLRIRLRRVDGLYTERAPYLVVIMQDVSERKRMETLLADQMARLEAVNAISHLILEGQSAATIARASLERMIALLGCAAAQVFAYGEQPSHVMAIAAVGKHADRFASGLRLPTSFFGRDASLQRWDTGMLDDLSKVEAPSSMEHYWERQGMRSFLRLPLTMEKQELGFLYLLGERPHAFPPRAVETVREVAELLTIAFHKATW